MFVCTPIELTLTIWPDLRCAHHRQQPQDQAHGAEVVELHRPLEVVQAVVGERDRAPDRAAGVVDQDVDVVVLLEHLVRHPVDVVHVGEVAGVDVGDPAARLDLLLRLLELLGRAGDEQDDAAGVGDLHRRRLADPRRGAGDHHHAAADRLLERDVALQPQPDPHQLVRNLLLDDLARCRRSARAGRGPRRRASGRGRGRGRGGAPSSPRACRRRPPAAGPRSRSPRAPPASGASRSRSAS